MSKMSAKKQKEQARNAKRNMRKTCEKNSLVAADEDLMVEGLDLLVSTHARNNLPLRR